MLLRCIWVGLHWPGNIAADRTFTENIPGTFYLLSRSAHSTVQSFTAGVDFGSLEQSLYDLRA